MRKRRSPFAGRLYLPVVLSNLLFAGVAHACLGVERTITLDGDKSFYGVGNGGNMGLRHKEVVLTFDDGPSPYTTNKILRTLRQHCTKATFFVVGSMARAYPSTLRNVARAGHTIAHHSYSHGNLTRKHISASARDVEKGFNAVRRALGPEAKRNTHLFRYPYLARNSRLDSVVKAQGLLPVSASIMSQDWKQGSSDSVVNRVMRQLDRQKRGVILMHDIQRRTAEALPKLLRRLDHEGYKIVHIKGRRAPDRLYDSAPMIAKLNSGQAPKTTAVARAKPERKTLVARLREKHHQIKKRRKTRDFIAKAPAPSFDIAALMPAETVVATADANTTDAVVTGSTNVALTEPAAETRAVETQTVALATSDQTSPSVMDPVTKASARPSRVAKAKVPAVETPTVQPSLAVKTPASASASASASDSVRVAIATPVREAKALASASQVTAPAPSQSRKQQRSVPLDATPDETAIAMVTPLLPSAPSRVVIASVVHSEPKPAKIETAPANTRPVDLNKAPAITAVVEAEQSSEKPVTTSTDVALASKTSAPDEAVTKSAKAISSPLRRWFQRRRQQAQRDGAEPPAPTHAAVLQPTEDTKPDPSASSRSILPDPSKAEKQAKPVKSPLRRWFQRRREARERAREEARAAEQAAKTSEPERVSSL